MKNKGHLENALPILFNIKLTQAIGIKISAVGLIVSEFRTSKVNYDELLYEELY